MSFRELQHVLVRMHVDEAFARSVLAPALDDAALARMVPELDARDRAHLRAVDVRAFLTDPLRKSRLVHALLDELPCTAATVGLPAMFAFFSTPAFASCVREGGHMVFACAQHLATDAPGVAHIELTLARVRRRTTIQGEAGCVVRGFCETASVAHGALARFAEIRAALGPAPAERLAAGFRAQPLAPTREVEHVLAQGAGVSSVNEGVHALLSMANDPVPRTDVERRAMDFGLSGEDAREVVDDLVRDQLLETIDV